MTSPENDRHDRQYSADGPQSSEGTVVGEHNGTAEQKSHNHDENQTRPEPRLRVNTAGTGISTLEDAKSPSRSREQAHRLDDDLRLLQVEREISEMEEDGADLEKKTSRSNIRRERSRREEVVDDFDVATNPLHETAQIYRPPDNPKTKLAKFFKKVHNSTVIVRYFTYIVPVVLVLLIPLLIGALVHKAQVASVGQVSLLWFCVWLEIVWLTLWAGRIVAKALPYPTGVIMSLFTNNDKKWKDMMKQLELAATLFFWWLGIEISFLPTMINHNIHGNTNVLGWQKTMNKVLVSFLVLATLNFVEKIIIQLIAISFHLRTYQDRIELNKFQISSLTKLYIFSKNKLSVEDSEFEEPNDVPGSGARTPGLVFEKAHKNTKHAFARFGDVAGKIAGDFTGRQVLESSHPSQVILTLLGTTGGSQVLARRLYRTFHRESTETVYREDLKQAFESSEECDAAFSMFDKDLNGDISMEELEAVCVEIGRERKAITASLKDLDSVVSKLDNVLMVIVFIISALVLISLLSTAAASVLVSAGSTILALSWLLQATAQEFLQSIIFVFVKHPFDVGDRVTIYGITGATLTGDDYFVKEIALLYTEFKKMEGHVVQAPNSYLNTLFILNHRRSGGLAEAVPITIKFGTSLEQIDALRQKLLDFVLEEKREYQGKILTELRTIYEAHSITLNVIFFFKSSWQNELLRLQRRNKFICALMVSMHEVGIEGPRMRYPGQKESFPLYLQGLAFNSAQTGQGGHPDNPSGNFTELVPETSIEPLEPYASGRSPRSGGNRNSSQARSNSSVRRRGESISAMSRRLDFSLGTSGMASGNPNGDVFEDRVARFRVPSTSQSQSRPAHQRSSKERTSHDFAPSATRASTFSPGDAHRASVEGRAHSSSIHRNRFFGRKSQDDRDRMMETGMAGIPEGDSTGDFGLQRLDPRTGLVSPAAMRASVDEGERAHAGDHGHALFHGSGLPAQQWQRHWQQHRQHQQEQEQEQEQERPQSQQPS